MESLDPEESRLMHRYWALPEELRTPTLLDIGGRVERHGYFASDRQMGFFGARLREQEQALPSDHPSPPREMVTEPTVAPPSVDDFPWR